MMTYQDAKRAERRAWLKEQEGVRDVTQWGGRIRAQNMPAADAANFTRGVLDQFRVQAMATAEELDWVGMTDAAQRRDVLVRTAGEALPLAMSEAERLAQTTADAIEKEAGSLYRLQTFITPQPGVPSELLELAEAGFPEVDFSGVAQPLELAERAEQSITADVYARKFIGEADDEPTAWGVTEVRLLIAGGGPVVWAHCDMDGEGLPTGEVVVAAVVGLETATARVGGPVEHRAAWAQAAGAWTH